MKKIAIFLLLFTVYVNAKTLVAICTYSAKKGDTVLQCTGDYDPKKESDSPTIHKMYRLGWTLKTTISTTYSGGGTMIDSFWMDTDNTLIFEK